MKLLLEEGVKEDTRHNKVRALCAIAVAGLLVLGTAPMAANAVINTMYANNVSIIQNQVLSSSNYTVIGGSVGITLPGGGWYGVQNGRTVGPAGNLGGTYGAPNAVINWTSPQTTGAHADCWWTWPKYDGYTGDATCWVRRP